LKNYNTIHHKKTIVISDYRDSSVRQLGFSLYTLFRSKGIDVELLEEGTDFIWLLNQKRSKQLVVLLKNTLKRVLFKKRDIKINVLKFFAIQKSIKKSEILVYCSHLPHSFYCDKAIEKIRQKSNVKIFNFDLHYYLNMNDHVEYLRRYNSQFDVIFDGYLYVSDVTYWSLPDQIYKSRYKIGISLMNNLSYDFNPKMDRKFSVVVDFLREDIDIKYRAVYENQIATLKKLNIPFYLLEGKYSINEIRDLYKKCVIFFTCAHESFCLPVIENQLLGNKIVTPTNLWLQAHMIKDSRQDGIARLGSNFLVYDFNVEKLEKILIEEKTLFEQNKEDYSRKVVENFKIEYPTYFDFEDGEVEKFLKENGKYNNSNKK
jgi:hypothetical protein